MLKDSLGDVGLGLLKALWVEPWYTMKTILGALGFLFTNPERALRTMAQFVSRTQKETPPVVPQPVPVAA